MKSNKLVQDPVAIRIWEQYFKRLARAIRSLDKEQRVELELEVQDHLLQAFRETSGANEAERLLTAMEHLGEPDDFIKPMLADKLLGEASRTFTPKAVFTGLYYYLFGGAKRVLLGSLFGVGYVISFALMAMAVMKVFFPGHVGLLAFADGDWTFGFKLDNSGLKADVLGYWVIPIGMAAGLLIYSALTRLLRLLKQPQGQ
jgi:hypothetical protein